MLNKGIFLDKQQGLKQTFKQPIITQFALGSLTIIGKKTVFIIRCFPKTIQLKIIKNLKSCPQGLITTEVSNRYSITKI